MVGRFIVFLCALLVLAPAAAQEAEATPAAPAPLIYEVEFREVVQPVSANFLVSSLEKARESGAVLFLVHADTPGGLGSSTEEILDAFLVSEVPTVFYVTPTGAMAASAGFIIGLSADIFAAAPGTTLGAASAVPAFPTGGDEQKGAMDTALKKFNEIMAAKVRSMAEKRGRDPDLAAKAIFEAKAWSAEEALAAGLVDIVAATREDLLSRLDGRTIKRFDGTEVTLDLEGYRIERLEMSWRQRALNFLANPNFAYLMLLIGSLGILIEVYNPGMIVPGAVGAIALLLFAFSTQFLPINVVAVLLVLLAIGFFVAEVKITSYGLLTLGGILCLILGGLMLIGDEAPDIPELRVDPLLVVSLALSLGLLTALGLSLAVRAHRARVTTGSEGMVGEIGTAVSDLDPKGKVYLHGEYWDARSAAAVPEGAAVRVVEIQSLELRVEPAPPEATPPPGGSREEGE